MGARALVAYERADGRYSLHYSHWGAAEMRLVRELTPETPFGGRADRDTAGARKALAALRAGGDAGDLPPLNPAETLVNPAPLATGLDRAGVVARVDFHATEALYLVSLTMEVTTYLPLRTDCAVESRRDDGDPSAGVTVALDPPPARDAERLHEWADGARAVLADAVDRGAYDPPAARSYLAGKLRERTGDRELLAPE
jgi:hypothetical protein